MILSTLYINHAIEVRDTLITSTPVDILELVDKPVGRAVEGEFDVQAGLSFSMRTSGSGR